MEFSLARKLRCQTGSCFLCYFSFGLFGSRNFSVEVDFEDSNKT